MPYFGQSPPAAAESAPDCAESVSQRCKAYNDFIGADLLKGNPDNRPAAPRNQDREHPGPTLSLPDDNQPGWLFPFRQQDRPARPNCQSPWPAGCRSTHSGWGSNQTPASRSSPNAASSTRCSPRPRVGVPAVRRSTSAFGSTSPSGRRARARRSGAGRAGTDAGFGAEDDAARPDEDGP